MKSKRGSNRKHDIVAFFVVFLIILLFTALDYFTHTLSPEYAVPSYYFRNKIIFGTLLFFIAWLFFRNKKPLAKAAIISTIVAVLLQVRYTIEGYSLEFVIEFLFIHGIILFLISWLVFSLLKKRV